MRTAAFIGALMCAGLFLCLGAPGAEEMVQLSGNHPTGIVGEPSGHIVPDRMLKMTVTLKVRDPEALNRLLSEQQDPTSPNFHRWLTPQEFSAQFGPDPAQFKAVRDWLAAQGFEILAENIDQRNITFKGRAEQAERVFKTRIVTYAGGDSYANATDPYIPAQFAGVIGAISGLDNVSRAVPRQRIGKVTDSITPERQAFPPADCGFRFSSVKCCHSNSVALSWRRIMLDTPQIVQAAAQLTAIIHITVARNEIRNVMGPGRSELMAAVAAQGIAPAGPWFTHHLRMEPDILDFEISVPVTATVAATGRVKPGQSPAMTVARTVFHGGYEGLGAAWGEFNAWIAANGHTPGPDFWECYVVGPELSPEPATWRTELSRRLIG